MRRITLGFVVIWFGIITPSYSSAEPAISSCAIDAYLTGKSSPMAGNGLAFVTQGLKYVVDPRLVIAIAGAETTLATNPSEASCYVAHNAWNYWMCLYYGTCEASDSPASKCSEMPYASWEAGLTDVTKWVYRRFKNPGYTTIQAISTKYCTSGCQSWVSNVTDYYSVQLGGDTSNLGFSSISNTGCDTNPNPECAPASCQTFVPCNATSAAACTEPVCASTAGGGGVCVEGTTGCADLLDCTTSTDCPDDGICAVNTCCGRPVCVPRNAFCLGS